ncbi:MAG: homoserine dehydrogenase [Nitrososphaerota archaeon]|nr:homoserine dehydrogenase [Nitrososphaerota archaeon]
MKILLIGFGNVGKAFLQLLEEERRRFRKLGVDPRVVGIVDRGGAVISQDGVKTSRVLAVKAEKGSVAYSEDGFPQMGALEAIGMVQPNLTVEATSTSKGGPGLALRHIIKALESDSHVVSANKAPFAYDYDTIMKTALSRGKLVKYSATVGGGLPVLKTLRTLIIGDVVESCRGILNATSNYILTLMEEGRSYNEALKLAQEMGIAETDPTMDVSGIDTAYKITIIANTIEGGHSVNEVEIKGIENISFEDLYEASSSGYSIRLLGEFTEEGKLRVGPSKLKRGSMLDVSGTLNAVEFRMRRAGPVCLTGKGAGPFETAAAIIRDIFEIVEETMH